MLLNNVFLLATYGFYRGGDIGNALNQLEQFGFFDYILPFLLIFAIVFGIMSSTKIFDANKGINAIIALSVGLMALQFDFVPKFFAAVLPQVGVGLVVILLAMIFLGMFMDPDSGGTRWIFFGIGFVVLASILIDVADSGQYGFFGNFWNENISLFLFLAFIVAVIGIAMGSGSKSRGPRGSSPLERALRGD